MQKYRAPKNIDFLKVKSCILVGHEDCIKKMVLKNDFQPEIMKQWFDKVESLIDIRLDELSKTFKYVM